MTINSTSWHNAGKIFALGHASIRDIFQDTVIIEEKIDGSFVQFGIFNGELRIRSKNQQFDIHTPQEMFKKAAESIKELAPLLHEGWTYRGEYLQKPKHNALAYDRTPNKHIIVFDIATGHETYLSYDEKVKEATRIGLEVVPLIFQGKLSSENGLAQFEQFMDRISILGGQKIEGVVVKNYNRFGADGKVLMGKYVSKSFKEVNDREWKISNPTKGDIIDQLKEKYRNKARWHKSILHMKERGELKDSPEDIQGLLKEIQNDIEEECKEEIKDALYSWARKDILRHSVRGFPEFYKEELLKKAFEE